MRGTPFILVLRSRGDEETWEECQDFFYSRQVVSKGWNFIVLGLKRVSMYLQRFQHLNYVCTMHEKRFDLHTIEANSMIRNENLFVL